MAKDLLFEIGTEEIPHAILTASTTQFKEKLLSAFQKNGLEFEKIFVYSTPRRFSAHIVGMQETTTRKSIEKKGPDSKIAFDTEGNPTKALQGFLRSNQASVEDITEKEFKGNKYVFINQTLGGKPAIDILPQLLHSAIHSFNFPKTMKWGSGTATFVRPIRWILTLFGNKVLNFDYEGILSSNVSYGHRLSIEREIIVKEPSNYKTLLKEKNVIVNPEERREIIIDKIQKTSERLKAKPILSENLLDTVINLTEYPDVVVGTFEEEFLELPKEVLISEMVDHQKYIPLESKNGTLMNHFIVVTNTKPNDNIIRGNERVIRARFKDGKFFFDEDRKQPLENSVERLKQVVFAKGLGTLYDKMERLTTLSEEIAHLIGYDGVLDNARRTARLCKADLVSNMVYEFPELQGTMAYYYAQHSNESPNVSISVKEHYYPRFSGDELPSLKEGILVSLADRIDNLFAMYSVGKTVTGSKDPYALRRQTLGVIRILIDKQIHLDFSELFDHIFPLYKDFLKVKPEDFKKSILDFITTRIKTVFKEFGFSPDEVSAGLPESVSDIYDSYLRINTIHEARTTEDFSNLAVAFKRVKNILKGETASATLNPQFFTETAEKELYAIYQENKKSFLDAIANRDYPACVSILKSFRKPVDRFFNDVLVMDQDPQVKNNRIALLHSIDALFIEFIDFDQLMIA